VSKNRYPKLQLSEKHYLHRIKVKSSSFFSIVHTRRINAITVSFLRYIHLYRLLHGLQKLDAKHQELLKRCEPRLVQLLRVKETRSENLNHAGSRRAGGAGYDAGGSRWENTGAEVDEREMRQLYSGSTSSVQCIVQSLSGLPLADELGGGVALSQNQSINNASSARDSKVSNLNNTNSTNLNANLKPNNLNTSTSSTSNKYKRLPIYALRLAEAYAMQKVRVDRDLQILLFQELDVCLDEFE
jgi:hypothetical protein